MKKVISFDFEFRDSNHKIPNILCCATKTDELEKVWWLYDDDGEDFKNYIEERIEEGYIFLAHFASAEVRCLLKWFDGKYLLKKLRILDSYVLWKQLEKDPNIAFGIRYETDKETGKRLRIVSKPPIFGNQLDKTKEYGHYDEELNTVNEDKTFFRTSKDKMSKASLVEIVANQLDIDMDSDHKKTMRDIILTNKVYTEEQKKDIMAYCLEDIKYLRPLINSLIRKFPNSVNLKEDQIQICKWMISSAIIESNGFPVEVDKYLKFSENVEQVRKELIESCNKVHKFFENGTRKYDLYKNFIDFYKIKNFPTTKTGKYKADKKTLRDYWAYTEIKKLYETVVALSELRYFKNKDIILENIGPDNRCRVLTSPFGTITTRNAPSVKKGWFLAMSTWMRSLVSHPDLYGCDYSAQEILVMAEISKDKNLQKAYHDGDPYTWFAKQAKLMPQDGNGKKEYRNIRTLCKSLMLGIGYGMGNQSLANHLTSSRIESLTKEEKEIIDRSKMDESFLVRAEDILNQVRIIGDDVTPGIPKLNKAKHYKKLYDDVFTNVKKYSYEIKEKSRRQGYLKLNDGWTVQHFDKEQTKGNFEIQGNAAVMLREAVRLCIMRDIEVVATLHDAIYIMKNKDTDVDTLERCMKDASMKVIGVSEIRVETDNYNTNWDNLTSTWTKDRGSEMLKQFGCYFLENKLF